METEQAMPKKSDPVVIEAAGMRIWVDYRRGIGGDERADLLMIGWDSIDLAPAA